MKSKTCFNPTCKCKKRELERVVKIRCKNCGCSIIVEKLEIQSVTKFQYLQPLLRDLQKQAEGILDR